MTESETTKNENPRVQVLSPQTQHERWVKYGLNVGLSILLVMAIAVIVIILAQWKGGRIDTTVGRVNSLKPQTVNIIKDINTPTKLVALYAEKDAKGQPNTYRQPVVD